ncbi:tetratricopeptide repeat protein [Roseivirga echinicomitans]
MLKKFAAEEPNDPFNWYALANEYITESPEIAKEYFDKLMTEFPEYLPTYYHAAQVYIDIMEDEKALTIYAKGIALAEKQQNSKALRELSAAHQNLLYEME